MNNRYNQYRDVEESEMTETGFKNILSPDAYLGEIIQTLICSCLDNECALTANLFRGHLSSCFIGENINLRHFFSKLTIGMDLDVDENGDNIGKDLALYMSYIRNPFSEDPNEGPGQDYNIENIDDMSRNEDIDDMSRNEEKKHHADSWYEYRWNPFCDELFRLVVQPAYEVEKLKSDRKKDLIELQNASDRRPAFPQVPDSPLDGAAYEEPHSGGDPDDAQATAILPRGKGAAFRAQFMEEARREQLILKAQSARHAQRLAEQNGKSDYTGSDSKQATAMLPSDEGAALLLAAQEQAKEHRRTAGDLSFQARHAQRLAKQRAQEEPTWQAQLAQAQAAADKKSLGGRVLAALKRWFS